MTVMNHTARPVGKRTSYQDFTAADVDQAEPLDFGEDTRAPIVSFPRIVLQTTVEYAGYTFVVTFNDTSIADAAAVLEKRGCVPAGRPAQVTQAAPAASAPICPVHGKPMKPMTHADRQGRQFWCTAKCEGGTYCDERA